MNPHYRIWNLLIACMLAFSAVLVGAPASPASAAGPILAAGDIAIVGFDFDAPKAFAFAALVNIDPGTQINFTDNGWITSTNAFRTGEGVITWTATAPVLAGTVIVIDPAVQDSPSYTYSSGFVFSASGDQILAYQGDAAAPSFLYALNSSGTGWQADATSSNTSALPPGLTNGTTAVALSHFDNGFYISLPIGTRSDLLALISNAANWMVTDTAAYDLTTIPPFAVIIPPPTNISVVSAAPTTTAYPDATLTVTFSEPVIFTPDWFSLTCGATTWTDWNLSPVTTDNQTFTLTPPVDLTIGEKCTATVYQSGVHGLLTGLVLPANYVWPFEVVPDLTVCGAAYTDIHDIQGSDEVSPLANESVWVEGVVTNDSQEYGYQGGFYLQAPDTENDADPLTSEGVFVYDYADAVNVGDYVRLYGKVSDFTSTNYGQVAKMTELGSVSGLQVCSTNAINLITPAILTLPIPSGEDPNTYFERYEGMLVLFPQELTVEQNYFQGRFGQLTLGLGRVFTPYNFTPYDPSNPADLLENVRSMIVLDDNKHAQNPNPISYYPDDGAVRAGDTVGGILGTLDQGRINTSITTSTLVFPNVYYRIQPVAAPNFQMANPTPPVPAVGGEIKVASFNVLNYFVTLDDGALPGPYNSSNPPRGATSGVEFTRQQDKLVSAITKLDADVVGLMEIESWDDAQAPQALVTALNNAVGRGHLRRRR